MHSIQLWGLNLGRKERETRRKVGELVEQASGELLERYRKPIEANPEKKLIEVVNPTDPMALWFTHALIAETKTLKTLTYVLIGLTAVLAALTFRLVLP
jgi:hypothetical protein